MSKLFVCGAWDEPPLISWPWQAESATEHFYKLTGYRIRPFTCLKEKLHWQYFFAQDVNRLQRHFDDLSESVKTKYVAKICRDFYFNARKAKILLDKIKKVNYRKLETNELLFWLNKLYNALSLATMQIWFCLFLDKWYPTLDDSAPFKKIAMKARDYSAYLHDPARLLKRKLYNEVARRLRIPAYNIFYLLPEEIADISKGKRNILKKVLQRKKFFITVNLTNHYKIYEGQKAKQLFKHFAPYEQKQKIKLLRGFSAYPGKIRSKIHKILYHREFSEFKKGEILVTMQTLVSFVPLMRKSLAILTEFGGITSHAAVVSRELKKPCIVGIANLTSSFKNGDWVEVDATKGIVKKL